MPQLIDLEKARLFYWRAFFSIERTFGDPS
jgi:hypothetical protein